MSTMTKEKLSVEKILEKLDKGERIGIDEGIFFLRQAKKLLGKSELERFFSAAKAQAKKNPHLRLYALNAGNMMQTTSQSLLHRLCFYKLRTHFHSMMCYKPFAQWQPKQKLLR